MVIEESSELMPAQRTIDGLEQRVEVGRPNSRFLTYRVRIEGRYYFMKQLRPELLGNSLYLDIFRKEFELGQRVQSPYLLHSQRLMTEDNYCYLLTDYVNGETLGTLLEVEPDYFRNRHNIDKFLSQLLEGLAELHSLSVVHRDLKPSNIMLTMVNHDVRIIDYGCAYSDDFQDTLGQTSSYAPPECVDGKISGQDARIDIYAVGRILQDIHQRVPLSRFYRQIMLRCLSENPAMRFATAGDLLRHLHNRHYLQRAVLIGCFALCALVALYGIDQHFHYSDRLLSTLSEYRFSTYDFADDRLERFQLYYRITSDSTVELAPSSKSNNAYEGDIAIPDTVSHRGHIYKVTAIGVLGMHGCPDLVRVSLPNCLQEIGGKAFSYDTKLQAIHVPPTTRVIGRDAFHGCLLLSSVVLSPGLRILERGCFGACTSLQEISIPEGVTTICQDAFAGCSQLCEVSLPTTLTSLQRGVFWECTRLTRITLPCHLETLGDYCLMHCPSLTDVYNLSPTPQTIGEIVDDDHPVTIHVPAASLALYRQAPGWKRLKVVPIEE